MSIQDLTDEELNARYIEANEELARRRRLNEIPNEICELATQGRQIGVEEQVMVEAVTKHPEPEPATE